MADIPWHPIIQDILDEKLGLMSGKAILEGVREWQSYFRVDYFCRADPDRPYHGKPAAGVLPFEHLGEANLIEFKSIWERLDELTFRYYAARAMMVEYLERQAGRTGRVTLTILTTRRPVKILNDSRYLFERIYRWKYRSDWILPVEIHILIQSGTRKERRGEALSYIQVLEGDPKHQKECWRTALDQDLANVEDLKRIIMRISKERHMKLRAGDQKGRPSGRPDRGTSGRPEGGPSEDVGPNGENGRPRPPGQVREGAAGRRQLG